MLALPVVGQFTSPCAVRLQGGLSSGPEGFSHSELAKPTGTVSFSRDIGGFLKVTRRFVAIVMGDLERVGCMKELGGCLESEDEGAWNWLQGSMR